MDRRQFGLVSASLAASSSLVAAELDSQWFRVGVIGHSGRGDYGHGLDKVWLRIENTEIVAVADPDVAGRNKKLGQLKLKTAAGFENYRQMLADVNPDIVVVCPRHADQHHDMILAAIESVAQGIYVEKPFVRTPAEADSVIDACLPRNVKLAVAHRNRYHPTLMTIKRLIQDGQIGRLLEIRGRGKGDRRGGGEDLWVLGSHVLNAMAFYGGTPKRCSAVMLEDGKLVEGSHVHEGAEGLGPLAGNAVHARYEFDSGQVGYFDSVANDGTHNAGFGLRLIGSEGTIAIAFDKTTLAHFMPGNPFETGDKPQRWLPITTAGIDQPEPMNDLDEKVANHGAPVRDLVAAIREDRQPLCNMREAALTVEMICAVFESHRQDSRAVALPLQFRGNALSELPS